MAIDNSIDAATRRIAEAEVPTGQEFQAFQDAQNQLLQIQQKQQEALNMQQTMAYGTANQNQLLQQAAEVMATPMSLNQETQNQLSQYGLNQPRTTRSRQVVQTQPNNIVINNNTTNNIVGGSGGGPTAGREIQIQAEQQGRFKAWLSNVFAQQNEQLEKQNREFRRRESELARNANKMMRKLENIGKVVSDNLDPRKLGSTWQSQLKTLLLVFGFGAFAKRLPKLIDSVRNIEKKITGGIKDLIGDVKTFFSSDGLFSRENIEKLKSVFINADGNGILQQASDWIRDKFVERMEMIQNLPKHTEGTKVENILNNLTDAITILIGGKNALRSILTKKEESVIAGSILTSNKENLTGDWEKVVKNKNFNNKTASTKKNLMANNGSGTIYKRGADRNDVINTSIELYMGGDSVDAKVINKARALGLSIKAEADLWLYEGKVDEYVSTDVLVSPYDLHDNGRIRAATHHSPIALTNMFGKKTPSFSENSINVTYTLYELLNWNRPGNSLPSGFVPVSSSFVNWYRNNVLSTASGQETPENIKTVEYKLIRDHVTLEVIGWYDTYIECNMEQFFQNLSNAILSIVVGTVVGIVATPAVGIAVGLGLGAATIGLNSKNHRRTYYPDYLKAVPKNRKTKDWEEANTHDHRFNKTKKVYIISKDLINTIATECGIKLNEIKTKGIQEVADNAFDAKKLRKNNAGVVTPNATPIFSNTNAPAELDNISNMREQYNLSSNESGLIATEDMDEDGNWVLTNKRDYSHMDEAYEKNKETIYTFLRKQAGLTHDQACGVMGVIGWESAFDPEAKNEKGGDSGLCQWVTPSRQEALKNFAKRKHKRAFDSILKIPIETQLEFMLDEMKNRNLLDKLQGANSMAEALEYMYRGLENGSKDHLATDENLEHDYPSIHCKADVYKHMNQRYAIANAVAQDKYLYELHRTNYSGNCVSPNYNVEPTVIPDGYNEETPTETPTYNKFVQSGGGTDTKNKNKKGSPVKSNYYDPFLLELTNSNEYLANVFPEAMNTIINLLEHDAKTKIVPTTNTQELKSQMNSISSTDMDRFDL